MAEGKYPNLQIGELFGFTHSSVSRRVTIIRTKMALEQNFHRRVKGIKSQIKPWPHFLWYPESSGSRSRMRYWKWRPVTAGASQVAPSILWMHWRIRWSSRSFLRFVKTTFPETHPIQIGINLPAASCGELSPLYFASLLKWLENQGQIYVWLLLKFWKSQT